MCNDFMDQNGRGIPPKLELHIGSGRTYLFHRFWNNVLKKVCTPSILSFTKYRGLFLVTQVSRAS
uniref:Uncharacterized protein n=1 Tax=Anguilla anguilla TaxID=7936 RepID=A0A0E9SI78_ANGAN